MPAPRNWTVRSFSPSGSYTYVYGTVSATQRLPSGSTAAVRTVGRINGSSDPLSVLRRGQVVGSERMTSSSSGKDGQAHGIRPERLGGEQRGFGFGHGGSHGDPSKGISLEEGSWI